MCLVLSVTKTFSQPFRSKIDCHFILSFRSGFFLRFYFLMEILPLFFTYTTIAWTFAGLNSKKSNSNHNNNYSTQFNHIQFNRNILNGDEFSCTIHSLSFRIKFIFETNGIFHLIFSIYLHSTLRTCNTIALIFLSSHIFVTSLYLNKWFCNFSGQRIREWKR